MRVPSSAERSGGQKAFSIFQVSDVEFWKDIFCLVHNVKDKPISVEVLARLKNFLINHFRDFVFAKA